MVKVSHCIAISCVIITRVVSATAELLVVIQLVKLFFWLLVNHAEWLQRSMIKYSIPGRFLSQF